MTIAKVSCRTCKHFNGERLYACTLKGFAMNGRQANTSRAPWIHYSKTFSNPDVCKEWQEKQLASLKE